GQEGAWVMSPATDPAATFLAEAQELLEQLEAALLDMEERPDDRDLVNSAFRALHTLKGSGAMFGFDALAAFTHHVENAFDQVRKGQLAASGELVGVALASRDHMRALIQAPAEADPATGEALLARLAALVGAPAAGASAASAPKAQAPTATATWRIRFRLPADCMVMGSNPLMMLDELRGLGTCDVVALTDAVPALEQLDPTCCLLAWDVMLTTEAPRAAIDEVFLFVLDDMDLNVEPVDAASGPKRLGEILVERGDVDPVAIEQALAAQSRLGEVLVGHADVSPDAVASALAEQRHVREAEAARVAAKANDSIRVPAERLDTLMDRVGELVIAQARLRQLVLGSDSAALKNVAEEIERLAAELRDTTMGIRTVPIGSLFGRYRRLVRDLARDLGKDIALTTTGEETELDKTVIERLNDPLVHLIRNCADHGLESAEARRAAGKPEQGRVHLSAVHAGAEVLVRITDDGHGLDRNRIRAKAEEQGLIAAGAKLADGDIYQLIFAPGFSTASEVTSVSGRGVGMDVVRRTIDSLRGTVEIDSTPGEGTQVTLRLPLTLAIIDGLLVRVGRGRYVIPLAAVEECVELSAAEDARSRGRSFLNIRGDLVPFLRLREMFNSQQPADPYQKVVIVSTGELRVGLVVDQVIGDHQTVIKSLSKLHADVECFSGATILGDGTVALIFDVAHLVERGQAREEQMKAS
ncbi:MAG TPA: chemotaxis protein CheA, partial [Magnetospirillum sp.]|nr:chemotaxis protein CheA [Magnetospirillum sp.]